MAGGDNNLVQSPFARSAADDARFGKILVVAVAIFAIVGIAVPLITVPEIEREEKEKLPPQLARVLLEKEEIEPPPPPPEPEPEEEPEPEPEPEPEEQPEPEEVPEPEPEPEPVEEPEPEPEPVSEVDQAREVAKVSGILQFQDALADMRQAIDTDALASDEITRGAADAQKTERSLITSGAESDSGGINTAALSTNTAGVALSGRETTQVESPLGGSDAVATGEANENTRKAGERTDEEIRKVMSQHAAALDRLYRRALRSNPTLEGKVVLQLVISPDGSLQVSITSSGLNDPDLEAKILARLQLITFPADSGVKVTTRSYTLNFLPQL